MKHKDGLDIAALLLLLLVAIAAMVVPVALMQPALLAVPAVLVLIALCVVLYQRRRLRAFLARQLCSTDFENSRIQYSLANLPIPTVLVNDGRILWYNQYFRQDVLDDYDAVTRPVNRVLPELDLAVCSRPHGQDLKVGERRPMQAQPRAAAGPALCISSMIRFIKKRSTSTTRAARPVSSSSSTAMTSCLTI